MILTRVFFFNIGSLDGEEIFRNLGFSLPAKLSGTHEENWVRLLVPSRLISILDFILECSERLA